MSFEKNKRRGHEISAHVPVCLSSDSHLKMSSIITLCITVSCQTMDLYLAIALDRKILGSEKELW